MAWGRGFSAEGRLLRTMDVAVTWLLGTLLELCRDHTGFRTVSLDVIWIDSDGCQRDGSSYSKLLGSPSLTPIMPPYIIS